MKLLTAVNLILPKLGEHPVTSVELKHPTLAIILPELENELRTLLMKGWWFNEFDYTVYPDSEGKAVLGDTTLEFTSETAVQRGLNLFNPSTLSYVFTSPIVGRVRQYVAFEDLPESAAQAVLYRTMVKVYSTDIGLENVVKLWEDSAAQGYSDLLAEHCRQKKFNTRKSRRWRNFESARRG